MAAQAEQLRMQYITSIINKEFNGTAKFKGFQRSFETIVRLHDNAGSTGHRVAMDDEIKWELLVAILKDPTAPPPKGMDGRKFQLVQRLNDKYGERDEETTPQLVAIQLKILKQEGKPVDDYVACFEDIRDKVMAAQLATIMTPYNQIETFISGLDPALMKIYVRDNRDFRNERWEETKKKVRTAEVKYKLGEDPIFADNRKKYKTTGGPTSSASEDFDLSAKRHRQQATKYQQEKADLQRKLDEALNREKSLLEAQKKLISGNPTKNNRPGSGGSSGGSSGGGSGLGGNPSLAQVLCWNCWENDEAKEQLTMGREIKVVELNGGEVRAWSDGSRQEEVAAAAAVGGEVGEGWEEGVYLGSFATVMDAEMLGVGHSGVKGNERADRKAKEVAWVGKRMLRPDIVTPAGIRQAFPMRRTSKQTKWNREALRGLTYVVTDRGPQRWWLHKIGRADDPRCGLCEEGVAQNAAHLLSCPGVADGKGRKWEQIWEDPEWCEKLAGAVRG
ncbi:hypothetical protein EV426DRAFT_700412 [Tirmania nivea]|nr:hypothetical protein EV426DRAFT_700412 [Tirmania nivea]